MPARALSLRRPAVCAACHAPLAAGERAWWDPGPRTVTCVGCRAAPEAEPTVEDPPQLDRGQAGASAAREHERRRRNREARTREAHPLIGGLLLALRDAPQHETAFQHGAHGEQAVARSLERRVADGGVVVLHDRRMPGGRGNIDHLAVAPAGVFVIDAKHHRGKVVVRKPLLGAPTLLIARRDKTSLLDGLDRQVAAVRDVLADHGHGDVPVHGVLCFTQADLPLLGTLTARGHVLLYRRALARRLNADGPVAPAQIQAIATKLAKTLVGA